jgi:ankyrin repeat protein
MIIKRHRCIFIFCIALAPLLGGCGLALPSQYRTQDYTPVVAAAVGDDLATLRRALDKDPALINMREWDDATLLHDSVGQNHLDVAKYLLNRGADANAVTHDGLTALHMAAQNGNIAIIALLLERGANVNPIDSKGWTPMDRAVKWGHPDAAKVLRRSGGKGGASGV